MQGKNKWQGYIWESNTHWDRECRYDTDDSLSAVLNTVFLPLLRPAMPLQSQLL